MSAEINYKNKYMELRSKYMKTRRGVSPWI
jgi:hypothetical protein